MKCDKLLRFIFQKTFVKIPKPSWNLYLYQQYPYNTILIYIFLELSDDRIQFTAEPKFILGA